MMLFPVCRDGKHGYIDSKGIIRIPLNYDFAIEFGDGLACVTRDGQNGWINTDGETVIPFQSRFTTYSQFSEGLCDVEEVDGGKCGYIDEDGRLAIAPQFEVARPFRHGVAVVASGREGPYTWIDQRGRFLTEQTFELCGEYSEEMIVCCRDGLYGYFRRDGRCAIAPEYYCAESFHEGLALAIVKEEHCRSGFIDQSNEFAIEPQFELALSFCEGLAIAGERGKLGFIDHFGNMVMAPQFTTALDFAEGLAAVYVGGKLDLSDHPSGGKWGFIDRSGRMVIEPQFQDAWPFCNGLAKIGEKDSGEANWLEGYINRRGEIIWPPT